jgi:tRNA (guanine-N7-)-methyltransferase
MALSPLFPDTLMMGMEIRDKVTDFVDQKITAYRQHYTGQYTNVSVMRMNAMKFLPNFFEKGQVGTIIF